MIRYPDFTGYTLDETREILSSEYPGTKCHMIYYTPPRLRDTGSGSTICRIIRQRWMDGGLEFTVSPFQYNE